MTLLKGARHRRSLQRKLEKAHPQTPVDHHQNQLANARVLNENRTRHKEGPEMPRYLQAILVESAASLPKLRE